MFYEVFFELSITTSVPSFFEEHIHSKALRPHNNHSPPGNIDVLLNVETIKNKYLENILILSANKANIYR